MLWMGIWVHPYTVIPVRGWGQILKKLVYGRTRMTLWCHGWGCKRLQTVNNIHIGCKQSVLSTLICCEWAYGCYPYTVIPVELGAEFWKIGVWPNLNDIVVSWLRLQEPSDYVPHPYWMYTKCFSTLICSGWAYGCTLILLYLWSYGPNFEKLGYGQTRMMLECHGWGCKWLQTVYHIHIGCMQCVLASWYAVDGHMGVPLHWYLCR